MDDLTQRLRENAKFCHAVTGASLRKHLCSEAADEIERLQARITALLDQQLADQKRALDFRDERDALRAQLEAARLALIDAVGCIDDWGGYASEYFRVKHDHEGDMARITAAIDAAIDAARKP